ncbi:hypothetical protein [Brevundimonas denitrificans]|uniref:hypothetical protein n=1 Tax=Brevundimonas denitrificans TaxID=1443434 RepID=UPI00223B6E53|nr:hypothetical protein [Brevundimonas denitrificans]
MPLASLAVRVSLYRLFGAFMKSVLVAAVMAVCACLAAQDVVAQEATPSSGPALEIYGRMPALESVRLSPDGTRLAHIAVVGEDRSLIIHDLADMSLIGGVRAGDTKVRDLDWIGNERVLITTTATQSGAALGIRRQELSDGQIYDISTRRVRNLLDGLDGFFPKLTDAVAIRGSGEDAVVYTRVLPLQPPARSYLYRIDPSNGRGQRVETGEPDMGGYVLNAAGEAVARTRYQVRTSTWSLHTKRNGFWRTVWQTDAPIDTPSLLGLGRSEDAVLVYGQPEDGEAGYYEIGIEDGVWSPLSFDFEPDFIIRHPITRLVAGAGVNTDQGADYVFWISGWAPSGALSAMPIRVSSSDLSPGQRI